MKIVSLIFVFFVINIVAAAQVTLSTDFTNEDYKKLPLQNIWTTANRISPKNGSNVRPDLNVNLVRMIGGINKKVNGENVPDLDFDPCRYDSITDTYVYDWEPLISRLDKIVNTQVGIHQIVLDQPPWAFQHGYTFIPTGTNDGMHFRENERVSGYGNSLPPYDKEAYFDFIAALVTKLIDIYGEEKVLSWRFRVGSEIETPDHWFGTEQDFIDHYTNSVSAIHSVLPNAKVGIHTRHPSFLYKNGTVLNYKGEQIASFADGLIEYCHDNNVPYDFWGVSDYVRINNTDSRTMSEKYNLHFSELVNHPKWNSNATLDLMEYNTITTTKGFFGCGSSHKEIVELAFANMFYRNSDKGLEFIHRWGNRPGSTDPVNIQMVKSMVGKTRYTTQISGAPSIANNELDAIFSKNETGDEFDVLIYNYNASSIDYQDEEPIEISFSTNFPAGRKLFYRSLSCGKEHNKLQNFLENEPVSGWVKDGADRNGQADDILNAAGLAAWVKYTNPNPPAFNEWQILQTVARTDGDEGSMINISTELTSFAFKKYEFTKGDNLSEGVNPPQRIWSKNEDFQQFTAFQMTTVIDSNHFNLSIQGNYPKISFDSSRVVDYYDKFRIVLKNETESQKFWFVWYKDGQKNQLRFVPGANETDFHTYTVDLSSKETWSGTIESFNIEVANTAGSGTVVIDSIELMLKNGVEEHTISVDIEGNGFVIPANGTAYTDQRVGFIAMPNAGWEFVNWTGDVSSTDNPLHIAVAKNTTIKAIFEEVITTLDDVKAQGLKVYPNPSKNGIFNLSNHHKWKVYNLRGINLLAGEGTRVNLSGFSKGIYLLKIVNGISFQLFYC